MANIEKDIPFGQKIHELTMFYLEKITWDQEPTVQEVCAKYSQISNEIFEHFQSH